MCDVNEKSAKHKYNNNKYSQFSMKLRSHSHYKFQLRRINIHTSMNIQHGKPAIYFEKMKIVFIFVLISMASIASCAPITAASDAENGKLYFINQNLYHIWRHCSREQRLFWHLTEAALLSKSHFTALKRGNLSRALSGALLATHRLHAFVKLR